MVRFQGHQDDNKIDLGPVARLDAATRPDQTISIVVSASDVLGIVKALYPQRRPASFSSAAETVHSGIRSSASSISGFSLFQHSGSLDMPTRLPPQLPQDEASAPVQSEPDGSNFTGPERVQPPEWHKRSAESEVDPKQLWQVCATIEDTLNSDTLQVNQWASMMVVPGERSLLSFGDHLHKLLGGIDDQLSEHEMPAPVSLAVLEQILPDWPESEGPEEVIPPLGLLGRLMQALEIRVKVSQEGSDFIGAHHWFKELQCLRSLPSRDPQLDSLHAALDAMRRRAQQSLECDERIGAACEGWFRLLTPALERRHRDVSTVAEDLERMRDKMWFVADVRTSAAYDEARSVAGALRIMGKPKRPSRARMAPPLRHWSGSKFSNTSLHLKTEAQTLELLSALPDQGGPNKLSDDQARGTLLWMERNGIENLCRGEERLHRLCMEVRKCVEQLVSAESALIYNNPLFARRNPSLQTAGRPASLASLSALQSTAGRLSHLTLQTSVAPSIDGLSSASHALSSASSRDYLESCSPTLTHRSSALFWSPAMTEEQSPSSATSTGSYHTQTASGSRPGTQKLLIKEPGSSWLEQLKRSLTSLLLSDLTSTLFNDGSETDRALWTGIGGELVHKHLCSRYSAAGSTGITGGAVTGVSSLDSVNGFDYDQAFQRTLRSFSASSDPSMKLSLLYDIDRLMYLQAKEKPKSRLASTQNFPLVEISSNPLRHHARFPRAEDNVSGFCRLFSNADLRPRAIFRDLQYIAALVPAAVLESTPQGKAFWNAAIATSQMKQDARNIMVETADSIIAYHSNNRGHGRTSSTAQQQRDSATFAAPSRTSSAEDIARYSMADAAYLLQVTAKEGDPVAQRELATLYLTHPELMDHIIAPFARPRDVFKEELESKWRKNQDPNRCDPATMCVAHHWMSLSSKGGDALAKEYLRQREEMERLP
ncbi:hypothetical protein LTR36_004460 [Oleoguttula mirabilis]|uniref:Uncharacterized protein n=1 Tax=Oleoguttula mirabilis TaxID=1507867 RepID=A0AAV9JGQ0_9PEZI|nr:hypothetical protein LTR36_004460 [Oleoguttula mirabilis]